MNTSIFHRSLKYTRDNFETVSKLSQWAYDALVTSNVKDQKIIQLIKKHDFEVAESIITLIEDKTLLEQFATYSFMSSHDTMLSISKLFIKINYSKDKLLTCAINCNYVDIAELLIQNDAKISRNDSWFSTCIDGHLDMIKLLLKYETIYTSNNIDFHKIRAVKLASECGHFDIVKFLIDNNVDIHFDNDAALRYSSAKGHFDIVKLLIDNGACY